MAARIKADLGPDADVVEGQRGEFSVWVGNAKVAEKCGHDFPADDAIVVAVRRAASRANGGASTR